MHLSFLRKVHNSVFGKRIFRYFKIVFRQINVFWFGPIWDSISTYALHTHQCHPFRKDAKLTCCSVR